MGECDDQESDSLTWHGLRGWDAVSQSEQDVYLVEALLERKKGTQGQATSCSLGGAKHWTECCKRKKCWIYRVKWVGYEDTTWWVCERDIGKAAIEEYNAAHTTVTAKPSKHAGALAAAYKKQFEGQPHVTYVITESDEATFKNIKCQTLKEFQYEEQKRTSAGVLALVSSCGLFLKLSEIFGSESLTQVHDFLFQAYRVDKIQPPKVLVYDDACHLKRFLINRPTSQLSRWLLSKMVVYCDRFHFPNHKSEWCRAHVDPSKCTVPGFDKANTEAAEQAFAWLAGAKRIVRHMNEARFLFYILRMAHLRNVQLCKSSMSASNETGFVDSE